MKKKSSWVRLNLHCATYSKIGTFAVKTSPFRLTRALSF